MIGYDTTWKLLFEDGEDPTQNLYRGTEVNPNRIQNDDHKHEDSNSSLVF